MCHTVLGRLRTTGLDGMHEEVLCFLLEGQAELGEIDDREGRGENKTLSAMVKIKLCGSPSGPWVTSTSGSQAGSCAAGERQRHTMQR